MNVLQNAGTSQQGTTEPVPVVPSTRRVITRATTVVTPRRRGGMMVDWV
jgi:hypothetical protein